MSSHLQNNYLMAKLLLANYSNCCEFHQTTVHNLDLGTTTAVPQTQDSTTLDDIVFLVYYYGILIILSLVNIVGNSIVITGLFRNRSLLVPGHYFIISLALSDICLGLVFPLYNVSHVDFVDVMDGTVGKYTFTKYSQYAQGPGGKSC